MADRLPHPADALPPIGRSSLHPLAVLLFLVANWLFVQWLFAGGGEALTTGRLGDTDCYTRLIRVQHLLDSGDWFDTSLPRYNAPFGGTIPWSRPLDVLLIIGKWFLQPFFPPPQALFWAGFWISPLLHLLTCIAMYWTAGALLTGRDRLLALLVFIWQFGILRYSCVGRPDHHSLITLVFVIGLGFLLRALRRPDDIQTLRGLGIALACGMWVSVECQITLGMAMFTLLAGWWLGRIRARPVAFTLCPWYLAMVAIAIIIERRPSDWLTMESIKISALHLIQGLVMLVFWGALARRDDLPTGDRFSRGTTVLSWGILAAALLAFGYRLSGQTAVPMGDPHTTRYLSTLLEFQSLWPPTLTNFQLAFLLLGHLLISWSLFPLFLPLRGVPDAERENRQDWLLIWFWGLFHTVLSVWRVRFVYLANGVAALLFGRITGQLLDLAETRAQKPIARAFCKLGIPTLFLIGPLIAGFMVPPDPAAPTPDPDLRSVCADLADPRVVGSGSFIIATSMNFGPEIAYRTPHRIIAAPYLDLDGIRDVEAILQGTDDTTIRALLRQRRGDLLLVFTPASGTSAPGLGPSAASDASHGAVHNSIPASVPGTALGAVPVSPAPASVSAIVAAPDSPSPSTQSPLPLERRLLANALPEWISEVPLPRAASEGFRLFRPAVP